MIESSLNGIFQGNKQILWSYIDMFTQVDVEVDGGQRGPSVVDLREWPYMGPSLQVKDNEKESENHPGDAYHAWVVHAPKGEANYVFQQSCFN